MIFLSIVNIEFATNYTLTKKEKRKVRWSEENKVRPKFGAEHPRSPPGYIVTIDAEHSALFVSAA